MAKKQSFIGFFRDGINIKAAKLTKENEEIYIEGLYKSLASGSEEKDTKNGSYEDDFLSAFEFEEKSETKEEPSHSLADELKETLGESLFDDNASKDVEKLKGFIEDNILYDGKISVNLDIENVKYFPVEIEEKMSKKKILHQVNNRIADEALSDMAYRKNDYFPNNEEQVVGISYKNSFDLLENIISSSAFSPKREYIFSAVQSNEIALINALRYNYDLFGVGLVAIFYVGTDFSRIILMEGNSFHSALPIINEGSNNHDIIRTMYSRYLLERSHADLPDLERIYVAGESLRDDWKTYLQEQEEGIEIERLLPRMLLTIDSEYEDDQLAEFIIPIMLAMRSMFPKNETLIHTNLIPKSILEQQNAFSIGIPGVVILILIFFASYYGLQDYFKLYMANSQKRNQITTMKNLIAENKAIVDSIIGMEQEIGRLENNIRRVKEIIGEKNQWHFVLDELSKSYVSNSLSWATNLKKENNGIKLQGTTTVRKNIVAFSQLFPKGRIEKVNKRQIDNYTLWDFDILYSMPDPVITQRLDYQREGIVYRRKEKVVQEPIPVPLISEPKVVKQEEPKIVPVKKTITNDNDIYKEALALYRQGKLDDAKTLFAEYFKNNNDLYTINAKYYIAETDYRQDNFDEAKPALEEIVKINKRKVPESLLILGNLSSKQGNRDEALAYWKSLVKRFPNSRYSTLAHKKIDENEG